MLLGAPVWYPQTVSSFHCPPEAVRKQPILQEYHEIFLSNPRQIRAKPKFAWKEKPVFALLLTLDLKVEEPTNIAKFLAG
jgi:hypothetical protein